MEDEEGMWILIRDQKTTPKIGTFKCLVPSPVKELLHFWISHARQKQLNGQQHDNVFLNLGTGKSKGKAFDQQGFSKAVKRAYLVLTKLELNVQSCRRVFAEGMHGMHTQPHAPSTNALIRILEGAQRSRKLAVACHRHAYR
jgi:hypothetical protein